MPLNTLPPHPALGSLRLATASDIPRLADISVLGFQDSEIFRYERPRYDEYPEDAVASFANIYRAQLLDPRAVVIVAEDRWKPDEVSQFARSDDRGSHKAEEREKRVVVGVASWVLPEDSPREGQFVVPVDGEAAPSLHRDLCRRRLETFTGIAEATEKKYAFPPRLDYEITRNAIQRHVVREWHAFTAPFYILPNINVDIFTDSIIQYDRFFAGKAVFNKLVVHPSYRRRGHATSLIRWGLQLCRQDGTDQGVIPSHVGEPLYLSLGYRVIGEMKVPDDGDVKGFTQRVTLYEAAS